MSIDGLILFEVSVRSTLYRVLDVFGSLEYCRSVWRMGIVGWTGTRSILTSQWNKGRAARACSKSSKQSLPWSVIPPSWTRHYVSSWTRSGWHLAICPTLRHFRWQRPRRCQTGDPHYTSNPSWSLKKISWLRLTTERRSTSYTLWLRTVQLIAILLANGRDLLLGCVVPWSLWNSKQLIEWEACQSLILFCCVPRHRSKDGFARSTVPSSPQDPNIWDHPIFFVRSIDPVAKEEPSGSTSSLTMTIVNRLPHVGVTLISIGATYTLNLVQIINIDTLYVRLSNKVHPESVDYFASHMPLVSGINRIQAFRSVRKVFF